jgi:hypothetical protein
LDTPKGAVSYTHTCNKHQIASFHGCNPEQTHEQASYGGALVDVEGETTLVPEFNSVVPPLPLTQESPARLLTGRRFIAD